MKNPKLGLIGFPNLRNECPHVTMKHTYFFIYFKVQVNKRIERDTFDSYHSKHRRKAFIVAKKIEI